MFFIEIQTVFCASHQLRLPGGALEPLHGHNWCVTVQIGCAQLDSLETVIDFHEVETLLARAVEAWNNRHLNDVEPFAGTVNPSAERVAEEISQRVDAAIQAVPAHRQRAVRVTETRITEAANCLAIYRA